MNEFEFVEDCNSIEKFLSLVKSLGEVIVNPSGNLYDVVVANDGTDAKKGSFSHKFGYQNFPLHTDTAYWSVPARLLVMWSPDVSTTATTILTWREIFENFSEYEIKMANDAIFFVNTFEKVNYRGIKFISSGKRGYRYDPNIMLPANEQGKIFVEAFDRVVKGMNFYNVNWSGSNALIIKNWEVLHGRNQVKNKCEHRRIFRAYVR